MLHAQQVDELLCMVSRMDRPTIKRCLTDIRSSFPIDLTPQFVETVDLDRLRHIFLAVCLQTKQMPSINIDAALLENVA